MLVTADQSQAWSQTFPTEDSTPVIFGYFYAIFLGFGWWEGQLIIWMETNDGYRFKPIAPQIKADRLRPQEQLKLVTYGRLHAGDCSALNWPAVTKKSNISPICADLRCSASSTSLSMIYLTPSPHIGKQLPRQLRSVTNAATLWKGSQESRQILKTPILTNFC